MPSNFKLSPEIIIGIFLITTGVYTFAKGTADHLANNNFKKSKNVIENILKTASSSNILINDEDVKED